MRGGVSRLYSIFFRSVWQMPQASTRIRISPGPIAGVGISSTLTTLLPAIDGGVHGFRYVESRQNRQSARKSPSTRAARTQRLRKPEQLRQANQRTDAMHLVEYFIVAKWPSGRSAPIEIIRHVFAGKVGDHSNAIERNAARCGSLGDSRRLPFPPRCAPVARSWRFSSGGLRHVIDGAHHAHVMRALSWQGAARGNCATGAGDRGAHHDIGDVQVRGERPAETRC